MPDLSDLRTSATILADYSLDAEDYSDSFLEQKAALFVNSIYDSEWYNWGEVFGYDAHYIDVDGGVDVGNNLQNKVLLRWK